MTGLYRYCGLVLASELALPELPLAQSETQSDLMITLGQTPSQLPGELRRTATFVHNGREALWLLEGTGYFHVRPGGRQIVVEPMPKSDEASLRLMLLHPVFALASLLRGDWLLNAAAVSWGGDVFAFIGTSASGKSTAAALLLQQGFRLVSDSLLRLTPSADGCYLAHPQAPWLLLWPDTLRQLAEEQPDTLPVRPGIALQRCQHPSIDGTLPLTCVGLLREQRGDDLSQFASSQRPGGRGFETLLQHIAGYTWLDDLSDRSTLFRWGVGLSTHTRIERLDIPWGWAQRERLAEQLAQWAWAGRGGPSNLSVSKYVWG